MEIKGKVGGTVKQSVIEAACGEHETGSHGAGYDLSLQSNFLQT